MSPSARLTALSHLQTLRERRERVITEHARSALASSEHNYRQSMILEDEANEALAMLCSDPAICLDRWRMTAAQLNLAADHKSRVSAELAKASEDFDRARDRLKGEIARSEKLGEKARKAVRKFEAKKDEAKLRDVRSMRTALIGRN